MARPSLRVHFLRRSWLLALAAALAACTLNPQPLPPGEDSAFGGGGETSDGTDRFGADASAPNADSGAQGGNGDGGSEVKGDAGRDAAAALDAGDDGATSSDAAAD
jgi:hypothetical protein